MQDAEGCIGVCSEQRGTAAWSIQASHAAIVCRVTEPLGCSKSFTRSTTNDALAIDGGNDIVVSACCVVGSLRGRLCDRLALSLRYGGPGNSGGSRDGG